ncbi:MAG: hypothetical protein RJB37_4001, partial [Pseudomonadota bacterium]
MWKPALRKLKACQHGAKCFSGHSSCCRLTRTTGTEVDSTSKMITEADPAAKRTLLGAVLIKFATGLAAIWGTCNVYFFSHLKHTHTEVTLRTNSTILLCALLPTALAVLLSNPFARLV